MKLDDNYIKVFLTNDDKTLSLCIGFFGYTYKMVENYIKEQYIDCDKKYVQKWTNVKYLK